MALSLVEKSPKETPFALCGSSERDQTNPVFVNTFSQFVPCDFGLLMFSFDKSADVQGVTCLATGTAIATTTATATVAYDPLEGVREVVSAITHGHPLETSQRFDALLRRAAEARGTPEDIEAWARELADDSGDLTD
jgi:hypothetical protein